MKPEVFVEPEGLQALISILGQQGYQVTGPQVIDGTLLMRPMEDIKALPWGLISEQKPGQYRLTATEKTRAFAWANGPQALKPLLFAPEEPLWRYQKTTQGIDFEALSPSSSPLAVLGVRSCDLAALALQDAHFASDPAYQQRRQGLLLIAVNCQQPASTCFCQATGDGPNAETGFDLLLDELEQGFALSAGSERGKTLLLQLSTHTLSEEQKNQIQATRRQATQTRQPQLPPIKSAKYLTSKAWEDLERRCLSCGNCTSVCPTCFCHAHRETPSLDGLESLHSRVWDSCFNEDHSYLHGFVVRNETRFRYRQWLSHKFTYWQEQYGRSGCVGCGRCISWCPAEIDITAELQRIFEAEVDQ